METHGATTSKTDHSLIAAASEGHQHLAQLVEFFDAAAQGAEHYQPPREVLRNFAQEVENFSDNLRQSGQEVWESMRRSCLVGAVASGASGLAISQWPVLATSNLPASAQPLLVAGMATIATISTIAGISPGHFTHYAAEVVELVTELANNAVAPGKALRGGVGTQGEQSLAGGMRFALRNLCTALERRGPWSRSLTTALDRAQGYLRGTEGSLAGDDIETLCELSAAVRVGTKRTAEAVAFTLRERSAMTHSEVMETKARKWLEQQVQKPGKTTEKAPHAQRR